MISIGQDFSIVTRLLVGIGRIIDFRVEFYSDKGRINNHFIDSLKASGQAINSLAQVLHCNFYEVMELDLGEE